MCSLTPCYIMYLRQVVHLYSSSLPSELKAALPWLQKSPVQKRTNLGELPTCSEIQLEGEEGEYGGRGAGIGGGNKTNKNSC